MLTPIKSQEGKTIKHNGSSRILCILQP